MSDNEDYTPDSAGSNLFKALEYICRNPELYERILGTIQDPLAGFFEEYKQTDECSINDPLQPDDSGV